MSLAPDLRKIRVDVGNLYLDPNNPRLYSQEAERIPLDQVTNHQVQLSTAGKLFPKKAADRFRIDELVESIRENRYVPEAGGYIFVRRLNENGDYLVLEGNRRLMALRQLLSESAELEKTHPQVLESITKIDVQELTDDIPEHRIQEKISYLLGTCHHGSHKNWSPFARAKGIYERYLEVSGQDDSSFEFNKKHAEKVASILSIKEQEVESRLKVYCVMS